MTRSLRLASAALFTPLLVRQMSSKPRPSYLTHAPALLQPCTDVAGEMHTSIIALGPKLGLHTSRWGINLESLPHGTRSSVPHAHSTRDEFVYVVSGSGLVWLDGITYEVGPGDCVGFPAGTGEAHAFIKDGIPDGGWKDEYDERVRGGPLVLLVIGENGRDDTVWYPRGEHEHPSKMRPRSGRWPDPPNRTQGPHSGWPFKPRTGSGHGKHGPPLTLDPSPAAFWPTTGRVLHAKIMPAPCPFIPGAASAILSSFTGLSGRFDVTQLRLPPGVSSHSAPAAFASSSGQRAPDAAARAQSDTVVYILEGQGELHVWNARDLTTGTETSAVAEGDCAVFPGGSGLAWAVRNSAAEGSKADLDVLVVEENIRGDSVVYPCAINPKEARESVEKEGGKWWDVANELDPTRRT